MLSSGPVVEPDVGVSWALALTMWREESGEPVSCREAFDEMASRVSGMSDFWLAGVEDCFQVVTNVIYLVRHQRQGRAAEGIVSSHSPSSGLAATSNPLGCSSHYSPQPTSTSV